MNRNEFDVLLSRLEACYEARDWLAARPDWTPERIWAECPRGDWLMWLAGQVDIDRRALVLAACDCAELAAPYWTPDTELACVWAIDAARRWARGETELDEVRAAYTAASYAYAAASYAAAAAAAAAAYAAAAYAAYTAAASAAYTATYTARERILAECADFMRARISWTDVEAAILRRAAA